MKKKSERWLYTSEPWKNKKDYCLLLNTRFEGEGTKIEIKCNLNQSNSLFNKDYFGQWIVKIIKYSIWCITRIQGLI